jgi:hypothetical protein
MVVVLLAKEVLEEGNGVGRVANQEALRLGTVVLVAVDVGENRGDLSVCDTTPCQSRKKRRHKRKDRIPRSDLAV